MPRILCGCAAALISAAAGQAANVYVLSSGDPTTDQAAVAAIVAGGHTATLGVAYPQFDGSQSLAGFSAVYFQANFNWNAGDMPAAGQAALLAWVAGGGGLLTSEWTVWKQTLSHLQAVSAAFPAQYQSFNSSATATYSQAHADPVLNAGLPPSFQFPLTSFSGTESNVGAKPGARIYYQSTQPPARAGVVGWSYDQGRVINLSTTVGVDQLADANFKRLLGNCIAWVAAGAPACHANCDGSTVQPILNVSDFICFQTKFAAGDPYANCDGSTIQPVLNVSDFICYQSLFAAGCP